MKRHDLLSTLLRRQSGQALISMLVFMALGAIILAPVLNYIGTGLIVGELFQTRADEYYAADAGVEDALWQIKNDNLETILTSPSAYDRYNFTENWDYDLTGGDQVNDLDVDITVGNEWIPYGLPEPDADAARAVIEGPSIGVSPKLIVTGQVISQLDPDTFIYQIHITYTPGTGDNLTVSSIGIWFPSGFTYSTTPSPMSLETDPTVSSRPTGVSTETHKGSSAVVWEFDDLPFGDLRNVDETAEIMTCQITLYVDSSVPNRALEAVSWIDTNTDLDGDLPDNVTYAWDGDVIVNRINSVAGSTQIDAYSIQGKMRQLGSAVAGDYFAIGNSLLGGNYDPPDNYHYQLYDSTSASIEDGDIPESASTDGIYLYWSGWIDWHGYNDDVTILEDNASNFNSPPISWTDYGDWDVSSGEFRAHHTGSNDNTRILAFAEDLDLSLYSEKTVTVSWNQDEGGDLESDDTLEYGLSSDGGLNYTWFTAFSNDNPADLFSISLDPQYLVSEFRLAFRILGFTGGSGSSTEYAYVDNISIVATSALLNDSADDFTPNWTSGSSWNESSGDFRGYGGSSTLSNNRLTLTGGLDLSEHAADGVMLIVTINDYSFESSDRLYVDFSANGGATWSVSHFYPIYNGSMDSGDTYSISIPSSYLTSTDFKVRFEVDASSSNEYVEIDDILILPNGGSLKYPDNPTPANLRSLVEDSAKVNQVLFNGTVVVADSWQILPGPNDDTYRGTWYYTAMADVTDLVHQWMTDENDGIDIEPNGIGDYTVGHVFANVQNAVDPAYSKTFEDGGFTGYPLGTPAPTPNPETRYTAAYAGWSLLTIYSSPETKGHQLYLYDIQNPNFDFFRGWHDDFDFDQDGNNGGTISGFLVPAQVEGETLAGRVTVFVGEGDAGYTGDYFQINGSNLFNGSSPSNNVWNSDSPGLSVPGVDIDTFEITWNSNILNEDDTSAEIHIPTDTDGFSMIYIIFSFRSSVTSGGAITYLIH